MKTRTEADIMKKWLKNSEAPLVTVFAISYCHEKYLNTALDSILSQETSFPFEVIVHDDASSDGSPDIIKEYAERYPHIIYPVLEEENQFSKGVQAIMRAVRPHIRGKYLAYLDCDDYWTDVNKLQEQADFLDKHPAFLAVAHNCTVVGEDGAPIDEHYPECRDEEFTVDHFFSETLAGQLGTLMVRDIFTQSPEDHPLIVNSPEGPFDRALNLTLLQNGRVHCIQKCMSAYRHVTDSGTSFSATFRYDIRRDARFYLSFVDYCKKMGRIGDAIGMLRWFTDYAENYKYDTVEDRQLAESILAFCRRSITSLTDQLLRRSEPLVVYVRQPDVDCYTEENSVVESVSSGMHYNCEVSISEFGEITDLRIDPMQKPCVLRHVSAYLTSSNGERISSTILRTNAISFQDALIFDNDDPQIEFCIPQGSYRSVSFSCHLISTDNEEIGYLRSAAGTEAKVQDMEGEIKSLTEQLAATRHNLEVVSGSIFWRISKPARIFADAVRGFFQKVL